MSGINDCTLKIGGQLYGGWTQIRIERSLECIAGTFELDLTAKWPGVDVPPGLREGLPCELLLGDDTVITGFIDRFRPSLDQDSSTIHVEGRDKTGDLVDCAAIYKTGAWAGVKLEQIVRDIAGPFGMRVLLADGVDTGDVFKNFALEDCEKAFDAIDRACRLRAVLCTSTPAGDLLLTHAAQGPSTVALLEGVNIKRISADHSWQDRFSVVTVKAQTPGDDDTFGAAAAHLKAEARDPEINRYRPLVVMAEHHTSSKSLAERAEWEVKVRMGRGKRGDCTVAGWRTGKDGLEGPLWQPNMLAHVVSPYMQLEADMLIVSCAYGLGPDGRTTTLTFARPEAFEVIGGSSARRLGRKLSDRTTREKKHKKHGDPGYTSSWDLAPPQEVR